MPKFFFLVKIRHTFRRVKFFRQIFSPKSGRLIICVLILIIGFLNLMTLSMASTRGYYSKNLEKRITELKKENQKINLQMSGLSSPQFLEEAAKNLGMIVAKDIKYLSPTTGSLVAR